MSSEQMRDPKTPVFEDPEAESKRQRAAIIDAGIAAVTVYDVGKPGNTNLWPRAKELKRADLWALAGYGQTNAFDTWSQMELDKLRDAYALHLGGKTYTGTKYVCSCSAEG